MIGGQVADLEGEGKPPDGAAARIHPPRQDRRAAARQPAHGRHLRRRERGAIRGALLLRRAHRAWRFRLWTTFWTWRNPPRRSARPRARMRRSTRSPFPRSTAWSVSHRMAEEECARAHQALDAVRRARRAAARTGRSDRAPQVMKNAARPAAGGARSGRVAREGAGADHGRRGAGGRPEGFQARPAGGGRRRASKCWRGRPT